MTALCGARLIRFGLNSLQTLCFQQSGHASHATTQTALRQLKGDSPSTVATPMIPEHFANHRNQLAIVLLSQRLFCLSPCIKAGSTHFQQITNSRSLPGLFDCRRCRRSVRQRSSNRFRQLHPTRSPRLRSNDRLDLGELRWFTTFEER